MKNMRLLFVTLCGNMIDYYDFLLFAHLGTIIVPVFIPDMGDELTHMLSLLLFAVPFLTRPLGGFIFGKVADEKSRKLALVNTLIYASIATLGIAILPPYAWIGASAALLFFLLRCLQGVSLGGESPTAGTFLMGHYTKNQGLISGMLCASGTVGGMVAFGIACMYALQWIDGQSWRYAFLLAGLGAIVSSALRRTTPQPDTQRQNQPQSHTATHHVNVLSESSNTSTSLYKGLAVFVIGGLGGVLCWLPMMYSQFYVTKVLGYSSMEGLKMTAVSLTLYVVLSTFMGWISDRLTHRLSMILGAILATPLVAYGYYLLTLGMWESQIFLIIAATLFGSPTHAVMNSLFHGKNKSRSINTLFMLGGSLGGLTPFLCAFMERQYGLSQFPVMFVGALSLSSAFILYRALYTHATPSSMARPHHDSDHQAAA